MPQYNNEKSTSFQHRFQSFKNEIQVIPRNVFEKIWQFRLFLHFSTSSCNFHTSKFLDVKYFANGWPFQKFSLSNFSITKFKYRKLPDIRYRTPSSCYLNVAKIEICKANTSYPSPTHTYTHIHTHAHTHTQTHTHAF